MFKTNLKGKVVLRNETTIFREVKFSEKRQQKQKTDLKWHHDTKNEISILKIEKRH